MKKLLIAAVLIAASASANAAVLDASLNTVLAGRADFGSSPLTNQSGTATDPLAWSLDTDTGLITTAGVLNAGVNVGITPLFFDKLTGATLGGGVGTAAEFECVNGLFAQIVGAQVCAGYSFGDNALDDSTFSYNPAALTFNGPVIGGDDIVTGAPRTVQNEWAMTLVSFAGGIAAFETADYFSFENGPCEDSNGDVIPGNCDSAGLRVEFSVVPVPAAVWLFGSALGLLGFVRRRMTA